jgi:ABC-type oligopeptide transport system substrate-binding subunit
MWSLILGLSVTVCGVVVLAGPVRLPTPGMHAQKKKDKPRTEDEDDAPKTATPDVTRIDDPDVKPTAPKAKVSGDLAEAAKETRNPRVKALLSRLAVFHDEVNVRGFKGITVDGVALPDGKLWVAPFVEHLGDPLETKGTVELRRIDEDGTPLKSIKVSRSRIQSVRYHEQIAVAEVKEFLDEPLGKFDPNNKNYLGRLDQLQVGETALAGVLQMHQSARERGARKGTAWDPVEAELRKGLLDVKLLQLDLLKEAKSWDAAFDFAQQLATTFDRTSEHLAIAVVVGALLEKAINDEAYTRDRFQEVRRRMRQIEEQFPANSKLVEPINASLRKQAELLFDKAKVLVDAKKPAEAADLLKQAEQTWPDLPGLRDYRLQVMKQYQILKVGMRELPLYLSPGWAHTDAEKRSCELIFESLVGLVPDEQGSLYYRPMLARSSPRVVPLGRQFELPRDAKWSDDQPLTVGDLSFTLKTIKKEGGGSERGSVWADVLNEAQRGVDPFRTKILLRQGIIDPLSAMSFKVLPNRRSVADVEFAKNPIGSGPFAFDGRRSEMGTGREFAAFKANPHYGSRANRSGKPYIRELRIYAPADPVAEMKADRLDMAVDLSAEQAAALADDPKIEVKLPTARTPNRRVYFLAINHRKPTLVNPDLRMALALAFDREKLLDDHFRKGLGKKVHRAINGPYPAGSWACSPLLVGKPRGSEPTLDPFDAELAKAKLRAAMSKLAQREISLTVKFPSGDPVLASAVSDLCRQVNETLKGVTLTSAPLTPHQLREAVEQTHDYELAYYCYDFPDESYWLKPLLGGDNYLGYTGPLQGKIESAATLRHFSQVQEYAHAIHRQLLEGEMPLIPLWQLDPLIAVRKGRVEMPPIDPQALFTRVEEWHVRGEK